jgi:hypothetical protein
MVKIIAEVTYSFYANTIRRDNNVQIVTSENEKSYYCQAIGTPFKKNKEKEVQFIVGGVVPYLSVFKTTTIREEDFANEKVKQYVVDNLNAELVEIMKEGLKERLENVNIK